MAHVICKFVSLSVYYFFCIINSFIVNKSKRKMSVTSLTYWEARNQVLNEVKFKQSRFW